MIFLQVSSPPNEMLLCWTTGAETLLVKLNASLLATADGAMLLGAAGPAITESLLAFLTVLLLTTLRASPRLSVTDFRQVRTRLCPTTEPASSGVESSRYTTSMLFPSKSRTAALK